MQATNSGLSFELLPSAHPTMVKVDNILRGC